jgi:hypothetical protein
MHLCRDPWATSPQQRSRGGGCRLQGNDGEGRNGWWGTKERREEKEKEKYTHIEKERDKTSSCIFCAGGEGW